MSSSYWSDLEISLKNMGFEKTQYFDKSNTYSRNLNIRYRCLTCLEEYYTAIHQIRSCEKCKMKKVQEENLTFFKKLIHIPSGEFEWFYPDIDYCIETCPCEHRVYLIMREKPKTIENMTIRELGSGGICELYKLAGKPVPDHYTY